MRTCLGVPFRRMRVPFRFTSKRLATRISATCRQPRATLHFTWISRLFSPMRPIAASRRRDPLALPMRRIRDRLRAAFANFARWIDAAVGRSHDPLFRFHRWLANLRVLEIDEIKSVPYVPISHPFVECLIGTIRREYLDHVFFWNAGDLARKLDAFADYYNAQRVHRALAGSTPAQRAGALSAAPAALDHYGWQRRCRGLFQIPIAA